MKPQILVILILGACMPSLTSCTKTIEKDQLVERGSKHYEVNSDNPFTGFAEEYYPQQKDKPRQIKERRFYEDGYRKSIWQTWYENGIMEDDIDLSDNGHWYSWHENGQKHSSFEYRDGERHGVYTRWYENGQLSYQVEYVKGKKQGLATRWDLDGNIDSESMYKDDLLSGEYVEYYPYDRIKIKGEYQDSIRKGSWEMLYENGKLLAEATYDPQLSGWGDWTFYSENGQKIAQGKMLDDQKEGSWTIWKDGDTTSYETGFFESNERDSVWMSYESGVLREMTTYAFGKGSRFGDYVKYAEDGKIEIDGYYQYDKKSSLWTYYDSGVKQEVRSYIGGELYGSYYRYYPNGKLQEDGYYKDGEKDGWWTSYNKYGRKTSKTLYARGTYITSQHSYLD